MYLIYTATATAIGVNDFINFVNRQWKVCYNPTLFTVKQANIFIYLHSIDLPTEISLISRGIGLAIDNDYEQSV